MKAELARRKAAGIAPGTEKDLAAMIRPKAAQSSIHDLLNKADASYSQFVPAIHELFGWDPPPTPSAPEPVAPVFSDDAREMARMYDMLPDSIKKSMYEQTMELVRLVAKKPS